MELLTDAKLQGLKPPETGQREISDSKVPGLRARIGRSGKISFVVRKRIAGTMRVITLGHYSVRFTLADARKSARSLLSDIEEGTAPVRKVRMAGAETIKSLWPAYRSAKSSLRSIKETERIFNRHILPEFGDRVADKVTRGDITRFIDSIDAPVMARAVVAQLSAFYGWALPRLDGLASNPCIGAGKPTKPTPRTRVLTDDELGALWSLLETQAEPWRSAVRLLILTGQRRNEVFDADRSEFDLANAIWTIPAKRAKNGQEHIVPLSSRALEIVEALPIVDGSNKLFPAYGNLGNSAGGISKATSRIRKELEKSVGYPVPHWTLHDLRRTVATGLQKLGVRFEVTEAVLNHKGKSGSGIAAVYQRHDWKIEKQDALKAWGAEVLKNARGRENLDLSLQHE